MRDRSAVDRRLFTRNVKVRGGTNGTAVDTARGPQEKHVPLCWIGYSCGLPVCALVPRYAWSWVMTHVLAAIVSCSLRNSTLARFPGTVPAFLCASFHLFQVLACHCEIIQNLYGLESNGPNPNRKLAFSLFIWNHEAESVGHLFLLLH